MTYAYDPAGHRTAVGGSLANTDLPQSLSTATYNAANQLVHWNNATMTYDANGNLISDGTLTYSWNARNQLASLTGQNVSAAFQYDAFGRRQAKAINSVQTNFLFDGPNLIQEQGADGSVVANVLTGLNVDENYVRRDSAGSHMFIADGVNSTLALLDASGSFNAQYTYDPFGNTSIAGSASNSLQYTGRENDGAVLYYVRARYYNPNTGRFISEDPAGFASGDLNLYMYGFEDPINYRDPYGTDPLIGAPIGALFGAIYGALGAVGEGGGLRDVVTGAIVGGAVGAGVGLFDPTLGVGTMVAIGGIAGGLGDAATQLNNGGPINWTNIVGAGMGGAIGSGTGAYVGGLVSDIGAAELEATIVNNVVSSNIGTPVTMVAQKLLGDLFGKLFPLPSQPSQPSPKEHN